MKNNIYKLLVIVFYILSFFCLLLVFKFNINITRVNLILFFMSCFLIYLSGYILVKKLNFNKKILRLNLILYFIIYTFIIIKFTLFEQVFGRNGLVIANWNRELLKIYADNYFNIVPLKTIKLFIEGYLNGYVTFKSFAINILGNIFILIPYGVFIPSIFKKINKFYKFLILMIVLVLSIEILQFVTRSGSCDIDDLILNLLGASIGYLIYKIKYVRKMFSKIFLYE